jgi:Ser/Thr protein kinase RdoA (MazF antagonist)
MIAAVEDAYALGRWRSWHRTDVGASNTSWFVETDAGSFVLRRSHPLKTMAGGQFEAALIEALRGHGYPAPAVQRTRSGGVMVVVDGVIHMVMSRLPGTGFDHGSPAHLAAAARGLARYHAIVLELTVPTAQPGSFVLARLGPAGQAVLAAAVEAVAPRLEPDGQAALRDRARYLAGHMEHLHSGLGHRQDELTTLVVHGSYAPSALLFDEDRLSGVLDFDRAAHDLLGLDLAYALDAFCRPGPVRRAGFGLDLDLARAFLGHYRTWAPVADADLRSLPELFRAQRLSKVLKKCDNVLAMRAIPQRKPNEVPRFARVLEDECTRVRWSTRDLSTLTEDT